MRRDASTSSGADAPPSARQVARRSRTTGGSLSKTRLRTWRASEPGRRYVVAAISIRTVEPRPGGLKQVSYSPVAAIPAIGAPPSSSSREAASLRATSPRHSISFFSVSVTSERATRIEATLNAAAKWYSL